MFRFARVYSGLLFTCRALENMQADHSSELRACFMRSYDEVLRHQHGWFIQSAVTVGVSNPRIGKYIYFSSQCVSFSVGHHHGCPLPIRILQADIPRGISGGTGERIVKMAGRAQPDRRPHEALPRRRRLRHGIESGAVRRLSSFVVYATLWITHFRSYDQTRRNDDARSVCCRQPYGGQGC